MQTIIKKYKDLLEIETAKAAEYQNDGDLKAWHYHAGKARGYADILEDLEKLPDTAYKVEYRTYKDGELFDTSIMLYRTLEGAKDHLKYVKDSAEKSSKGRYVSYYSGNGKELEISKKNSLLTKYYEILTIPIF